MRKHYTTKRIRLQNALIAEYDSLGAIYTAPPVSFTGNGTNSGNLLYFYHPDHLGSSSLITNADGVVTQHVEYIPFGEVFIEERNKTWNTPYLFNGKERDEETGLYYYGARYYDSRTSVWLSVDPLANYDPINNNENYWDGEHNGGIYNLGSIQAVTDEYKNVVSSYYYTPWGGRVLLSGVNITDRGYTFHEHLEPFGLINMNGRVYDPVLARFLSPDPYVQAPDYTQNFNRYSYCYNNPFKYIDPSGELQIGPFYISLNLGWGYGSGFYFGISAGVGIEGAAYAGISIGYNTSGSFSFSASAGIAGFYVSGGYDTKGGWNGSAGWSAPLPSLGIVSFNTNMLGVSGSYSQNGGWSYNHMGVSFSKNGVSFSPSVGVGIELYYLYNSNEANNVYSSNNDKESNSENTPITVYNHEKETEVWNYVQDNTVKNQTEYAALITSDKILVRQLSEGGGNPYAGLRVERILGKHYITHNEIKMKLIAMLHTHPGKDRGADNFSYYGEGKGSDYISAINHRGVVYYLMTENGCFRSMIFDGKAMNRDLIKNVNTVKPILNGSVKLIPITKTIYNYFNK